MIQKGIHFFIALVWLVNGLFCKILDLEPRHQEIVGVILGIEHSFCLTKIIGILELIMFIWIASGFKYKLCAITQIAVIMAMNFIEFFEARQLLLFGKWNVLFASFFSMLIYYDAFVLSKK